MTEPALRNVSDTALLVAVQRARESERRDALFNDPYARLLAGERGESAARQMAYGQAGWPVVARTVFFDRQIQSLVSHRKVACVLNLAAGLDARPYRLDLPPDLLWIEADLPDILADKAAELAGQTPRCRLERVPADLSDAADRGRLLDRVGPLPAAVLTEGLLVYLQAADVGALAGDLAARPGIRFWLTDLSGPQAARWGARGRLGRQLASAGATHRFAPEEGPDFLRPYGWTAVSVVSTWKEARRLGRLPWPMRLLEAITPRERRDPYYNLIRACLFERAHSAAT